MQSKETKKWQDEEALKRYQMIAPLLDESLDEGKRRQLREEIAERNEISKRSLYRYEAKFREEQFDGLRPMNREKRRSQVLPDNYEEIVGEAIQLKREVPRRSVRQIIKILESEGYAPPGVIKASTLQRYLYNAWLGVKQMKRYTEKRETTSRRFCRAHRNELWQGDIKYGPDIRLSDGRLIKTYDVALEAECAVDLPEYAEIAYFKANKVYEMSQEERKEWLQSAANKGNECAAYELAELLETNGEAEAADYWKKIALSGGVTSIESAKKIRLERNKVKAQNLEREIRNWEGALDAISQTVGTVAETVETIAGNAMFQFGKQALSGGVILILSLSIVLAMYGIREP